MDGQYESSIERIVVIGVKGAQRLKVSEIIDVLDYEKKSLKRKWDQNYWEFLRGNSG